MKTESYTKTGLYHKVRGISCQDAVKCAEFDTISAVTAADGASSCSRSGHGALLACRAVLDFVRCEGEQIFTYSDEKLSYLVTEHVLYFLEQEANREGVSLSEYASTLCAAFICKNTGETRLLQLGDGTVFSVRNGTAYCEFEARHFRRQPCLTVTADAYRTVSVKQIHLQHGDGLLLCSDGFMHALRHLEKQGVFLEQAFREDTASLFKDRLRRCREPDDVSYIYVTHTTS